MSKQSTTTVRAQKYPPEFRQDAVRLTVTSGKSIAQVARDVGISVNTLHDWRRDARYAHRMPIPDNETTEQQIARLQQENELLRQERDI